MLLRELKIQELNLFETPEEVIERAYNLQGEKIAYTAKNEADTTERK